MGVGGRGAEHHNVTEKFGKYCHSMKTFLACIASGLVVMGVEKQGKNE